MATFNWCDDKFCSWGFENSVDVIWEIKNAATYLTRRVRTFQYFNTQWEINYDHRERTITVCKTNSGEDCVQDHQDPSKFNTGKDCEQDQRDSPKTDLGKDCAQDHPDSPKTDPGKDCLQDHRYSLKTDLGKACTQDSHKNKRGKDSTRDHQDCRKTYCSKMERKSLFRFQLCIICNNEVLHKVDHKKLLRNFCEWKHVFPPDIFKKLNTLDTLTLWCRIFRPGNEEHKKNGGIQSGNDDDGVYVLSEDLKAGWEDGKHSDVSLKLGQLTFPAHKMILSCRSKFFQAMFDHDTKENLDNTVDLVDMDEGVAKMMLQYIYTGKTGDLSMDNAIHLFSVADRYCLMELLTQCREFMVGHIDVDSVCDIAAAADMHSDEALMKAVQEFFRVNIKEIIKTLKWRVLSENNSKLFLKLVEDTISHSHLTPMSNADQLDLKRADAVWKFGDKPR